MKTGLKRPPERKDASAWGSQGSLGGKRAAEVAFRWPVEGTRS